MRRFLKVRFIAFLAVPIAIAWVLSRFYATPVLMYHHIDARAAEWKLSVSPESFSRQMEFLKAHRYRVIPMMDYVRMLKEGESIPKKSVVITFDDGYDNNFTDAYPVLKKMGFPATIFIQVDGLGREGYVTVEDLNIMTDNGIDIGSHTVHHGFLPSLSLEEQRSEIVDSKLALEELLGRPVPLFTYPGGGYTEASVQIVREAGYEGAATTSKPGRPDLDPYALRRIRISRTCDNLLVFWIKCSGFYQWIEKIRG